MKSMEITKSAVPLLFLFLVLLEAEISRGQKKDDCQVLDKLDYCKNNSRIMVMKSRDFYFVRLCHSNSQCMSDVTGDMNLRIRCRDVCDTCKALPGQNECVERRNCEEQVDKFLNDYCMSAMTTLQSLEVQSLGQTSTCGPMMQVGSQAAVTSEMKITQQTNNNMIPIAILAVLLALSLLLLAVVTVGWACTYWSMKKREEEKSQDQKSSAIYTADACYRMPAAVDKDKTLSTANNGEEEVYFKNPTYEGNSTQSGIVPVTYDTVAMDVPQKVEDEKTYDVPDQHWQADGTYVF